VRYLQNLGDDRSLSDLSVAKLHRLLDVRQERTVRSDVVVVLRQNAVLRNFSWIVVRARCLLAQIDSSELGGVSFLDEVLRCDRIDSLPDNEDLHHLRLLTDRLSVHRKLDTVVT